ncbi:MAG: hypothetical protein IPO92_14655 [Saprospiraceae bacterium]|nr:hypothetical protein [Saprospiraceae bacterium]
MVNTIIYLLLFTFSLPASSEMHAFHISRTEINYDVQSGDIQIASHIFIDDLENGLALSGVKDIRLCSPKESIEADHILEQYANSKLKITLNGVVMPAKLIGKEQSKDLLAVWCYLEISNVKNVHQLNIENKILIDLYNDQKNITEVTKNKKRVLFTIFDSEKIKDMCNM